MLRHRRFRFAVCTGVIAALTIAFLVPPVTKACTKNGIKRSLRKAIAKGNTARACRLINRFHKKYPGCVLPPGLILGPAACGPAGVPLIPLLPLGRGRGGGFGGGGPPGGGAGGGGVGGLVFVFNSANSSNCFSYTVVPDPANPSGFTVVGGSGTMTIPLLSMATAPFTVDIAPGVPIGTCAFFDVIVTDKGNGLEVPDDFKRVKITVLDKLEVIIDQTDFRVIDGVPSLARWRVRNLDTVPVVVPYAFSIVDDPGSIMEDNAGGTFPVPDAFSMPRSAAGGGSVALDAAGGPNDEDIIEWFMVPGEYCDPAMIGCCIVEIPPGNAVSGQCFVNVNTTARCCPTADLFLIKGTATGGFITVTIGGQVCVIPLPPAATEQEVVDLVAQAVNQKSQVNNGFDFTAIPMFEELAIEHRAGVPVEVCSGDPGLFIVRLPGFDFFDEFNVIPDTLVQRRVNLDLDGHPNSVSIELIELDLTGTAPINIDIINTVPMSEPDTSSIQTFDGDGAPILFPGDSYTATADFVSTAQFTGPITFEPSPVTCADQSFTLLLVMSDGTTTPFEFKTVIQVRPNGFDGVGQTQVIIDPASIQATITGPNSFQYSYQAQVQDTVVGIQHEHIISAGATNVPNLCLSVLGDLNADLEVTGRDLQIMIDAMLASLSANDLPCADFNGDGIIDPVGDTPGFVAALLN